MLPVSQLKKTNNGKIKFVSYMNKNTLEKIDAKASTLDIKRTDLVLMVMNSFVNGDVEKLKVL